MEQYLQMVVLVVHHVVAVQGEMLVQMVMMLLLIRVVVEVAIPHGSAQTEQAVTLSEWKNPLG
mgnify:CR=1 FL=1